MVNMRVDFANIMADAIGVEHGLTESDFNAINDEIESAHKKINEDWKGGSLGFLDTPESQDILEAVVPLSKTVRYQFTDLVVLGIGGSALGTRLLISALLPPYYNFLDSKDRGGCPRIFVCDNIDPSSFGALLDLLDPKGTCVNVVSKSGKTTETAAQFFIIKDILVKKFGSKKWCDHVVITTDPLSGPLRTMAVVERLKSLSIPINVGGRYSVLSPVSLFPAACVGIDVEGLLAGAKEMRDLCLLPSLNENLAYKNAAAHYLLDVKKGKKISVMMPYSDSLSRFGDWYVQLWAESLGKDGKGTTPIRALGATDQHSQLQLFMEGPNDKVITVVGVMNFRRDLEIGSDISESFQYLRGHTMGEVLHAEEEATLSALKEASRPTLKITLPEVSAKALGELIMFYEVSTAFAGFLYGINPFDQPGVELGKKLAIAKLSAKPPPLRSASSTS